MKIVSGTVALMLCASLVRAQGQPPATNAENQVNIKIEHVQMLVTMSKQRREPVVAFDYSLTVATTESRIRKPYVTCYYLIQNKDTTRTGRLGAKSGDGWAEINSKGMAEVDSKTVSHISETLLSDYND